MVGFAYKGLQFGIAGFLSSVVGHSLTTWLVSQRELARSKDASTSASDPKSGDNDGVELAPVLPTSLAWGGFLMSSSNLRYQIVNGIEQRALDPLLGSNGAALALMTLALRLGNCYVGGLHWLSWAKMWKLQ